MPGREIPTSEVQARCSNFMSKHGARVLVALLVLAFAAVGAAAGEGGELLAGTAGTESGDAGP
ncbi:MULTISPECIES: hypothetical protein [unclassified Haloparvum]|uniref:hypothetical protein n=1 Tax=Haloparvum sp. PAK95 TaxID=3418962 RepID=UPI003D2ECBF1